ncbi:pullulanase-type alpha-1,6-glucosidase [Corallincola holothuriorum]|uniref:Pullulanase-type alpha-1,6-glucosidase n=1 Tax=Corallincola holothuriorum TaxID=2282215 RepID=A0A368N2C1_9GAMM|nr:pullulanase-type alpha-1,6-glucosidase [Corallincola holothuriorum]RCU44638.1 pullulanase-type alpha-1,6-glucosidase [Corallincola holothuriorum]
MELKKNKLAIYMMPLLAASMVVGCSDDDDDEDLVCEAPEYINEAGDACIMPTVDSPAPNPNLDIDPPGETMEAAANQLVLNYVDPNASPEATAIDPDSPYAEWSLHLWNNENCDSIAEEQLNTDWGDTSVVPDGADGYGPYWTLDLSKETGCINFILRGADGNTKIIDPDMMVDLDTFTDRAVSLVGSSAEVYDTREEAWNTNPPGINKDNRNAAWVDATTILWGEEGATLVLYVSDSANFGLNADGTLTGDYTAHQLTAGTLSEETAAKFPAIADRNAYMLPEGIDAKAALKGQLYIATLSEGLWIEKLSKLQTPGAIDALYTAGEDDANEQELGAMVGDGATEFALWAPTAQNVALHLFNADKTAMGEAVAMTEDMNGIWRASTEAPHGTFYKYEITVYHYQSDALETLMVTDPYSMGLSTDSIYSQVIDFTAEDVTPAGWADHVVPEAATSSITVYESHVRDFSAHDESTSEANRGKYLAFTETDSAPMQHIIGLKEAGLTHFQLLPVFDIATIKEDPAMRVDILDTVGKLCGLNAEASVCGQPEATIIADLLDACDPATQCAETIMDDMRGLDSFNWGYDPFHFGAPEGSYASDADGVARINEFRQMVKALHDQGLRVVMDVVYNHTNASGLTSEKSVLDKVVPGYYNRFNQDTGSVETSTCCDNTATENAMMEKLMTDTLVVWADQYKIDSFRFDLMGHQPLDSMERSLAAVHAVDADNYFYGEGWNFGEVENDTLFVQATQLNLAGTGIGSFSDRGRDAIRGGSPFDSAEGIRTAQGLANGLYSNPNELNSGAEGEKSQLLHATDIVRVELAGLLADYALINSNGDTVRGSGVDYNGQPAGYTDSPTELVSYVSKHDNQTLWDNNQYKLPTGMSAAERARYHTFALAFPSFGQGVPFIHMGSDLLRSKSMERDSYDSGDWYNYVDFTKQDNNWNVGLPRDDKDAGNYDVIKAIIADETTMPAAADIAFSSDVFQEFLQIRKSSPLFTLGTKEAVMARVDFHNTGAEQTPGVIVMSIDDGASAGADLDENADAIVVVFNSTQDDFTLNVPGLVLHDIQMNSVDAVYSDVVVGAESVIVPGVTAAVFVMPQGDAQGAGIPVAEKSFANTPPYGDTKLYVRGDMNGWGTGNEAEFIYDGLYSEVIELEVGAYSFKVADSGWTAGTNFGYADVTVAEGSMAITDVDGNMNVAIETAGLYRFDFNARDTSAQTISVTSYADVAPYGDAVPLLRGEMNGWSEDNPFAFDTVGEYTLTMQLTAGDYKFKVADADWGEQGINLGGEVTVSVDEVATLVPGGGDNVLSIEEDGEYVFTLNAFNINKPTLLVEEYVEAPVEPEPTACELLDPSTDTAPVAVPLYVRGDHSGWAAEAAYAFTYKGDNIYQATFTVANTINFKIADDSDSWDVQFYVPKGSTDDTPMTGLLLDEVYNTWAKTGGAFTNNSIALPDAPVIFTFTVTDAAAIDDYTGTLSVCQPE